VPGGLGLQACSVRRRHRPKLQAGILKFKP
jgi:hypothetical protein